MLVVPNLLICEIVIYIKSYINYSNILHIQCIIQLLRLIYTHYIHSGYTRLCIRSNLSCEPVSLRVCRVNQYHYESRYHHTMYVISLSNISIKTNFKQIARVELKCVQYSEGDYILCMTSHYFSPFIHQRQVTVFCLAFQLY